MTRRDWLQSTALLTASRACGSTASPNCCTLPEPVPDAVHFEPGRIVLDLARATGLAHPPYALRILDENRGVRVLVACPARNRFVALDQKCTHGGGPLTYVHQHKHLYCTCWGHAMFDMDGSVLRWPNARTPKPLRSYRTERKGNLLSIYVEGLET